MRRQPKHEIDLYTCSIERVINTTIRILENLLKIRNEVLAELVDINLQDWKDLKLTTCKVWNEARNDLYERALKEDKKTN